MVKPAHPPPPAVEEHPTPIQASVPARRIFGLTPPPAPQPQPVSARNHRAASEPQRSRPGFVSRRLPPLRTPSERARRAAHGSLPPLRPVHRSRRRAPPPGGIQPPPPTSPLASSARRSRFVQPRGKQRARVKPLHIPNGSAGRAAYLAFLLAFRWSPPTELDASFVLPIRSSEPRPPDAVGYRGSNARSEERRVGKECRYRW